MIKFVIQPWLNPLIDYFWKDKSRLAKENSTSFEVEELPEEILQQLPTEVQAMIQDEVCDILKYSRTKNAFAKTLVLYLSNSVVNVK